MSHNRVILYPYKIGSDSSKALQDKLQEKGIKCIRVYSDGKYRPRRGDFVVNWGSSHDPVSWDVATMLNKPEAVAVACNKLSTFRTLYNSPCVIPQFCTTKEAAIEKLRSHDWKLVFCRTLLNSHSGNGIVVADTTDKIVDAPLYTEGVFHPNRREFRVHIFKGKLISISMKLKKSEARLEENGEVYNKDIRSFKNGWVFSRFNDIVPWPVEEQSKLAVRSLGLDFGAVDISFYYSGEINYSYIYEVNTSPGLEGETVNAYASAIIEEFNK